MRVYHFLSKEHGLQALEKQRLKVARINELNDPFELLAAELSDRADRQRFLKWKDETSCRIGFLCFSRRIINPLLWSHYADRHRGVALELEVDDQLAVPVQYRRSRMKLDIQRIKSSGGFSEKLAEQLGSTKSRHWLYEEEVRVAIDLQDCQSEGNLLFEPMRNGLKIVSITAGPLCELDSSEIRCRLAKGNEITLYYARIAFRSFDVVLNRAKRSQMIRAIG
ncbi:MAG: DUF2971 domain-containing protein [Candidatus Thiodiazotropha endolucinida]